MSGRKASAIRRPQLARDTVSTVPDRFGAEELLREPAGGLSFRDVIGPLEACFATTVDGVTEHIMHIAADRLEAAKSRIGDDELVGLRSRVREVLIQTLLDILREQITPRETNPGSAVQTKPAPETDTRLPSKLAELFTGPGYER